MLKSVWLGVGHAVTISIRLDFNTTPPLHPGDVIRISSANTQLQGLWFARNVHVGQTQLVWVVKSLNEQNGMLYTTQFDLNQAAKPNTLIHKNILQRSRRTVE